jgi:hypothetical protein
MGPIRSHYHRPHPHRSLEAGQATRRLGRVAVWVGWGRWAMDRKGHLAREAPTIRCLLPVGPTVPSFRLLRFRLSPLFAPHRAQYHEFLHHPHLSKKLSMCLLNLVQKYQVEHLSTEFLTCQKMASSLAHKTSHDCFLLY